MLEMRGAGGLNRVIKCPNSCSVWPHTQLVSLEYL